MRSMGATDSAAVAMPTAIPSTTSTTTLSCRTTSAWTLLRPPAKPTETSTSVEPIFRVGAAAVTARSPHFAREPGTRSTVSRATRCSSTFRNTSTPRARPSTRASSSRTSTASTPPGPMQDPLQTSARMKLAAIFNPPQGPSPQRRTILSTDLRLRD